MKLGIVGLPNVGKSTLFNAITNAGAESANYPFCTIEPNVGMVPEWIASTCVQCNQCAYACPHATIRPFAMGMSKTSKVTTGGFGWGCSNL